MLEIHPEQLFKILSRSLRDRFHLDSMYLSQTLGYFNYESRLVSPASIRNGSKKRTISFDQDTIQRDLLRYVTKVLRLFESNDS